MAQNIGPTFGIGKSGYLTTTGSQDINTRIGASGTLNTRTLTVDSISGFSAGDLVMIHKSRGNTITTAGVYEFNRLYDVSGSTLYVDVPLSYSYQDSGSDQTQVIKVPEYLGVTIPASTSIVPNAWDGSIGGISVLVCNGLTRIDGSINLVEKGFRGATTVIGSGLQGEGSAGSGTDSRDANGNGGGGGNERNDGAPGGGGGGNVGAGTTASPIGGQPGGTGGDAVSDVPMTKLFLGGGGGKGGGGGYANTGGGNGGNGAGILVIVTKKLIITGLINADGAIGLNATSTHGGGGGAGAGGSVLIKSMDAILGSNLITALAKTGGTQYNIGTAGGSSSTGIVRVETQRISGTTNPTFSSYGSITPWAGGVGIKG
jgi:hypothetical protein